MTARVGSCASASRPTGTESAMAYDPIMRWENEGGALLPAGSPALEHRHPVAARRKPVEPARSGFRGVAVGRPKRDVRRPPDSPAA
jgi:hypothetical protein